VSPTRRDANKCGLENFDQSTGVHQHFQEGLGTRQINRGSARTVPASAINPSALSAQFRKRSLADSGRFQAGRPCSMLVRMASTCCLPSRVARASTGATPNSVCLARNQRAARSWLSNTRKACRQTGSSLGSGALPLAGFFGTNPATFSSYDRTAASYVFEEGFNMLMAKDLPANRSLEATPGR